MAPCPLPGLPARRDAGAAGRIPWAQGLTRGFGRRLTRGALGLSCAPLAPGLWRVCLCAPPPPLCHGELDLGTRCWCPVVALPCAHGGLFRCGAPPGWGL